MQHGLEINLVFYQENRTNSGSQVRSCLVEDAMAAAGHLINKDIPLSGWLEQQPLQKHYKTSSTASLPDWHFAFAVESS